MISIHSSAKMEPIEGVNASKRGSISTIEGEERAVPLKILKTRTEAPSVGMKPPFASKSAVALKDTDQVMFRAVLSISEQNSSSISHPPSRCIAASLISHPSFGLNLQWTSIRESLRNESAFYCS
jgi:hypothetical protein